ncbi:MAG: hypothetical protein MR210_00200 [Erysipelotrichaceae bacterium]|nr:hypothetical protein [Erysipelotrichaceae bacterium]MDY5252947.1 hypothetical protein [Erysipelotrichaceae bacterium]
MKKWIIVTNKWTYLFLVTIIIGVCKILFYDLTFTNMADIGFQIFVSLMIMAVGVYFFVRFNSYSPWMNPDHPKSKKP